MADERMPTGQPPGPQGTEKIEQQTPRDPVATPKVEKPQPAAKPAAPAAKPAAPAAKPAAPPPKAPAVMAATPWNDELTAALAARFGDSIKEFSTYLGQNFLVAKPDAVIPIIEYLKTVEEFDYLVDITAVDFPNRAERFDLVYILYSFARNERVRVKTAIAADYKPQSATGVHLTADWLEREVFDMFGIEFAGHPHLKRILLPDEWEGHPLRKDKPITEMDNRWVKENLSIESAQ
jgi:NADH-quinone oxidoreductase subunit C